MNNTQYKQYTSNICVCVYIYYVCIYIYICIYIVYIIFFYISIGEATEYCLTVSNCVYYFLVLQGIFIIAVHTIHERCSFTDPLSD